MPPDERILVIPAATVEPFHGFRPADASQLARLLEHQSFHPRSAMETDPAWKQLIPYVLLRAGGRYFHYRRGAAGTEKRLTAKHSLGLGGHVADVDATYDAGMRRELREEVTLPQVLRETFLGLLNDDATPVGRVHLGVVHLFDLASEEVTANEAAIADGGFATLAELSAERDAYETWSQFALDWLAAQSP